MVAERAYLTPDEVAQRFNVPKARVVRWAREKLLHGIKIGREWRFTEADLEAFLQAQQEGETK
jgi:excisionase family DNA binding protein